MSPTINWQELIAPCIFSHLPVILGNPGLLIIPGLIDPSINLLSINNGILKVVELSDFTGFIRKRGINYESIPLQS